MYSATTHEIQVTVTPKFLQQQSSPAEQHYVWLYDISIQNHGDADMQLIRRYWQITNANGKTEIVQGDGVVGQQPTIEAGETYNYQSGCPLDTPSGIMRGSYFMRLGEKVELIEIEIPAFSLDSPFETQVLN